MLANSHNNLYFTRMANSIGDKSRILEYLTDGNVLDVGAGGGELSETMRLAGHHVVAMDGSSVAIDRIKSNYPAVEVMYAMSYDLNDDESMHSTFKNIVCSSVLHEIFSYGDPVNGPASYVGFVQSLKTFYNMLESGGRLIIRDGVMPANYDEPVRIRLKTAEANEFYEFYKENSPFYNMEGFTSVVVDYVDDDELGSLYDLNMMSAMEFLYTLTWGMSSAEREVQEFYGVLPMKGYVSLLEALGFKVIESFEYVQDGYIEHLLLVADIIGVDGNPVAWPSSNMVIVAVKP